MATEAAAVLGDDPVRPELAVAEAAVVGEPDADVVGLVPWAELDAPAPAAVVAVVEVVAL